VYHGERGRWGVPKRILAIDFGTRRMGLAVSDALGITAQGLPTLERTRLDADLGRLAELARQYSIERVVLGNPIGTSGRPTPMSAEVERFARKLRGRLDCPVELWDERLTSVEANRVLRQSGMGIEKRRRAVDRVAATLLLEGYLAGRANAEVREPEAASSSDDAGSGGRSEGGAAE